MNKRIFLMSLVSIISLLTFSSPALAKQPTIATFEVLDQASIDSSDYGFNYTVRINERITIREITFYNKDDSVNRVEAHLKIFGTVTNLATGTTFRDQASIVFTFDSTGGYMERGVLFHLHLPGKGVVVQQVGRVVVDENFDVTFVAGINMDQESRIVYCEGLAGL